MSLERSRTRCRDPVRPLLPWRPLSRTPARALAGRRLACARPLAQRRSSPARARSQATVEANMHGDGSNVRFCVDEPWLRLWCCCFAFASRLIQSKVISPWYTAEAVLVSVHHHACMPAGPCVRDNPRGRRRADPAASTGSPAMARRRHAAAPQGARSASAR